MKISKLLVQQIFHINFNGINLQKKLEKIIEYNFLIPWCTDLIRTITDLARKFTENFQDLIRTITDLARKSTENFQ